MKKELGGVFHKGFQEISSTDLNKPFGKYKKFEVLFSTDGKIWDSTGETVTLPFFLIERKKKEGCKFFPKENVGRVTEESVSYYYQ